MGAGGVLALLWCWFAGWSAQVARAEEPAPEAGAEADGEAEPEEPEEPEVVFEKPERVTIGMHLNDIQAIDLKTHSYALDFYVWFRWKNPELDPSSSMEIANPYEQWGHILTPIYEEPEELEDGSFYQVVRFQGLLSKKLPLYNYPFDRQVLTAVIEDGAHDEGELVYVVDEGSPTTNEGIQLPGYAIGQVRTVVGSFTYPTGFGDPRSAATSTYSRTRLEIPLTRPPVAYGAKLFLPVLCVVVCAALMFVLSPAQADARVDVGITSLLTVVALQITYNDALPDVGYLMMMDKVYLLAYLFVIVGLAVVVYTTRLAEKGRVEEGMTLHRRSLLVVMAAWLVCMGGLIGGAITGG